MWWVDVNKEAHEGTNQEADKGTNQEVNEGTNQEADKGTNKEANESTNQEADEITNFSSCLVSIEGQVQFTPCFRNLPKSRCMCGCDLLELELSTTIHVALCL